MTANDTSRILPCPTCGNGAVFSARNPDRPFCSARCRLIDLGEWASESHVIPGQTALDDLMSGDLEVPPDEGPSLL
ncbi:MAG: DNA gyrase inhibitor YacG [Pseudomonadota bacterium]